MPKALTAPQSSESDITDTPATKTLIAVEAKNTITAQEYSDHMSLTSTQLETVALMLQILEQADGGESPTQ
jgi:hypothetical protein